MLSLVAAALITGSNLHILFVGNSLVGVNDVPDMVKHMVESDGTGRHATVRFHFGPHLNDLVGNRAVEQDLSSGDWDTVVLQAAMVSMSHQHNYPQGGGIALTRRAVNAGSKTFLYSEWSRRGIDETEYTENVYRGISKLTSAPVIPVGRVWDITLKRFPDLSPWMEDGNHATPVGSYIAAAATYVFISGSQAKTPSFRIEGISTELSAAIFHEARAIWASENSG